MAPFPLAKLAFLAVKQVSKPVANSIKRRAKLNPFIRNYICMPPAQIYHWMEMNFRLRMMGLGGAKKVEPLSDKEAIELGGDMLGEFIVFGIGVLVLMIELQRQANKDKAKEEKSRQEAQKLSGIIEDLRTVLEIHKAQIHDLQKRVDSVTAKTENKEKSSWFSKSQS